MYTETHCCTPDARGRPIFVIVNNFEVNLSDADEVFSHILRPNRTKSTPQLNEKHGDVMDQTAWRAFSSLPGSILSPPTHGERKEKAGTFKIWEKYRKSFCNFYSKHNKTSLKIQKTSIFTEFLLYLSFFVNFKFCDCKQTHMFSLFCTLSALPISHSIHTSTVNKG